MYEPVKKRTNRNYSCWLHYLKKKRNSLEVPYTEIWPTKILIDFVNTAMYVNISSPFLRTQNSRITHLPLIIYKYENCCTRAPAVIDGLLYTSKFVSWVIVFFRCCFVAVWWTNTWNLCAIIKHVNGYISGNSNPFFFT